MLKGIRCGLPTGRGDLRIQCLATGLQRKKNKCKPRTCSQRGAGLQGPFSQVLPMVPVCFLSQHTSPRAFIPALSRLAAYTPVWWDCRGVLGHPQGPWLLFRCCAVGAPFPGLRPVLTLPLCSWPLSTCRATARSLQQLWNGDPTERRGWGVPPWIAQPLQGLAVSLATSTGLEADAVDPPPHQHLGQGCHRGSTSRNLPRSCSVHSSRQWRLGHPSSLWECLLDPMQG